MPHCVGPLLPDSFISSVAQSTWARACLVAVHVGNRGLRSALKPFWRFFLLHGLLHQHVHSMQRQTETRRTPCGIGIHRAQLLVFGALPSGALNGNDWASALRQRRRYPSKQGTKGNSVPSVILRPASEEIQMKCTPVFVDF